MSRFQPLLLGITFVVSSVVATAAPITVDSIPNPPLGNSSGPVTSDSATIASSDLVTDQYRNLGIVFPAVAVSQSVTYETGVTKVGGVKVWAPVLSDNGDTLLDFGTVAFMTGKLAVPGTNIPTTSSSVTVEIVGPASNWVSLEAFDKNGKYLGYFANTHHLGSHGGILESMQAPGISSFTTFAMPPIMGVTGKGTWGIAEIQIGTTPVATPEPGSILLLGLGALFSACWAGSRYMLSFAAKFVLG